MVPGRKFSTTTSALPSSVSNTLRSPSALRSRAIDSLPRFTEAKYVETPFLNGPYSRASSPLPGGSTLITRAPSSAIRKVQ